MDSTDDSLDEFVLGTVVLLLGPLICTSLEIVLDSRGLDTAEEEERMFKFTISLLGTTILYGGMKERSNKSCASSLSKKIKKKKSKEKEILNQEK